MSLSLFHRLRISDRRQETAEAVSLAFEVPAGLREVFRFRPGQYLTLRCWIEGQEVRRAYSICSAEDVRVAIKHVPEWVFSGHANTVLQAGDEIEVMAPEGRFGYVADPCVAGVYLGVAAGSGITPILSILSSILATEAGSRFVLLYGSRSTGTILFRSVLEDLKDRYLDRLVVVHVLSREAQDVSALNGRLDGAKLRGLVPGLVEAGAVEQAFVCGPAEMLDEVPGVLAALGVAAARIQVERFAAVGVGRVRVVTMDAVAVAVATVIHDGASHDVPVAEGETVLDAALRAGLDLPWSCHGGMCSTCRARVTEGGVRMAVNFSLEAWETEAGYALTCQAHPTTSRLVVDFDHI